MCGCMKTRIAGARMKLFRCESKKELTIAKIYAERDYFIPKRCIVDVGKTGKIVKVHPLYCVRFIIALRDARSLLKDGYREYETRCKWY